MQSQYYGFTEGEKMQRILLKLSGEALAGEKKQGFDEDTVRAVALQVKQLVDDGIQVGIVIGGGNFWRGRTSEHIDRTKADQIGMLATVMNCIAFHQITAPYCQIISLFKIPFSHSCIVFICYPFHLFICLQLFLNPLCLFHLLYN